MDNRRPTTGPDPRTLANPPVSTLSSARTAQQQKDFDEFFVGSYRLLVAYTISRGVSWADAEEIVDAALMDIDRHWASINEKLPYARRAVRSHIAQRFRTLARQPELVLLDDGEQFLDELGVADTEAAVMELRQWLMSRLQGLTPAMVQVIQGLVFDGMTVAEMSRSFRKSEAAIRKQLSLARARLLDYWLQDENPGSLGERKERG